MLHRFRQELVDGDTVSTDKQAAVGAKTSARLPQRAEQT